MVFISYTWVYFPTFLANVKLIGGAEFSCAKLKKGMWDSQFLKLKLMPENPTQVTCHPLEEIAEYLSLFLVMQSILASGFGSYL